MERPKPREGTTGDERIDYAMKNAREPYSHSGIANTGNQLDA
jgi:hypothetical protein